MHDQSNHVKDIFAEIGVFSALEKTLHYRVPSRLQEGAQVGCRVLIPLGNRESSGLILSLDDHFPDFLDNITFRPILAVLDSLPIVPEDLIALCRWVSKYYFYPLGEVLQTVIPSSPANSPQMHFRLTPAGTEAMRGESFELQELFSRTGAVSFAEITKKCGTEKNLRKELKTLEGRGWIERFFECHSPDRTRKKTKHLTLLARPKPEQMVRNDNLRGLIALLEEAGGTLPMSAVRQRVGNSDYWVRKLIEGGLLQQNDVDESLDPCTPEMLLFQSTPDLFPQQDSAFEFILPHVLHPSFKPLLLFGVTGSGKTEIYLRLVERALQEGKGALVLVPEIALSTQMEVLFRQRFGSQLAVWHSRVPVALRNAQWKEVLSGKRKVVLGVRSSVFMPVSNLGLIIVDEEHDSSYKQDDHLRYHARDVAIMRSRMLQIPVLLGSATPSLQSIHHCRSGRYTSLSLPRRVFDRPLPDLQVVDMRRESHRGRILSRALQEALVETVQSGQQALLFLNRRGFATFFLCNVCGEVLQCAHCSVSLTYHQDDNRLRCHYCGWERQVPEQCPVCGRPALIPHGFGTERVEEDVKRLLPGTPLVRMDRDTAAHPRLMAECLTAVRQHRAKVLIGTQMVAKGHDFPDITLVGVINADTALQLADYRAGETTVQLLMQVAGRAGRGDTPGRVILQTYNPSHYTIESVLNMDYLNFCTKELESRERLQYPPFTRFVKILVTSREEASTRQAAHEVAALCREVANRLRLNDQHVAVLGPAPAPLVRLKNRYRWHIFVKAWKSSDLQHFTEVVLAESRNLQALRHAQLAVDRDPTMSV